MTGVWMTCVLVAVIVYIIPTYLIFYSKIRLKKALSVSVNASKRFPKRFEFSAIFAIRQLINYGS